MRTRDEVWAEMLTLVADARAAAAEGDEISVDLDHDRLNDLITEVEHIPLQKRRRDR